MDFEKAKIEITWSGDNIGVEIKEGRKSFDWRALTHEERIKILKSIGQVYQFYYRFFEK